MIRRILSAVLALLFAATVADAMTVKAGSEDVKTYFCLRLAATGVAIAAPTITDIDLYYTRSGAAQAAKVDATALAAADSAHADNKAFAVGQGVLRVDWPDAAFAAGVREVILTVVYATAFTENLRVDLTPAAVDVVTIEGADATDTIRDSVVDDTTRIDASALNTLSGHDPGEAIMGATDLGTGSGFTAIPWNAAWDAEVQSEATDALNAYDPPTNAEMEARTLTAALYATAATQATNTTHLTDIKGTGFVKDTHSLPQCLTATGFSTLDAAGVATAVWNAATATYGTAGSYGLLVETDLDGTISSRSSHSAADVWAVGARTVTGGTITTYTGNTPQTADNNTILASATHGNAALRTLLLDVPTVAEFEARSLVSAGYAPAADVVAIKAVVDTILLDTGTDGVVVAAASKTGYTLSATGLDAVAKTATGAVALSDAVWEKAARTLTAVPTGGALEATLTAMKGATFDTATDSLEALRNRGDAAWVGSGLDAAGIRAAVGLANANLDTQLGDIPTVGEMNARTILSASYATATALATAQADLDNPAQYKATGFSTHSAADVLTSLQGAGTHLTLVKAVTDKLVTTLVQDGAVWDFTAAALAAAPGGGGGGDATLANQTAILTAISGVPASVWNRLLADISTTNSVGLTVKTNLNAKVGDCATPDDVQIIVGP